MISRDDLPHGSIHGSVGLKKLLENRESLGVNTWLLKPCILLVDVFFFGYL